MLPINDDFFQRNGGQILRRHLAERNISPPTFRVFTAEELDRATDGYSESRIIGEASNGSSAVYEGRAHHRIVAVKRCCHVDEANVDKFISELVALCILPVGKHIAGILGACCDGTPVPIVVYEYVPNGTLHHHIHDLHGSLCWEARLKIAAATAEALSCLHSAIPNPLFHRRVSAKDILLDEGMAPKVSDFGARLVKSDCSILSRILEGKGGYLPPEFMKISGTAEKGDVYSFGVVMAEMLTGEPAMSAEGVKLGTRFREAVGRGRLVAVLEERVREEAVGKGNVVEAVAELAISCLMVGGEERPTMREVAEELRSLLIRKQDMDKVVGRENVSAA